MESRPSLILCNVQLPEGRVVDLSIRKGVVVHAGSSKASEVRIDCAGMFVLPAAVDMHVHMRGGLQSGKEDWTTGSRSALGGGVTVVVDQPNTIPPIDSPGALRDRVRDAQEHSLCHFAINSSVTADIPFDAMGRAGAMAFGETFYAPSSYGEALGRDALSLALERIHAVDGLATIHAEEISTGPDPDLALHDERRSVDGEVRAVKEVQNLNGSHCRLHLCHLSSARSIDAASGSVEVTPHHLFLSRDQFRKDDPRGKVNPPLRSENHRRELLSRWDGIDVIASDHAPHTIAEKGEDFSDAPSGIPGVETMVPLLLGKVLDGTLSLPSVIEKTSSTPARLLGIPPAGFAVGDRGDFALYQKKAVRIRADMLHSKCGWTPYENHPAVFPEMVILGGEVVYHEGEFPRGKPSWFPGKGFVPGS